MKWTASVIGVLSLAAVCTIVTLTSPRVGTRGDVFVFLCDGTTCPAVGPDAIEELGAGLIAHGEIAQVLFDRSAAGDCVRFSRCPDRPPHPLATEIWYRVRVAADTSDVDAIIHALELEPGVSGVAVLAEDDLEDWCIGGPRALTAEACK